MYLHRRHPVGALEGTRGGSPVTGGALMLALVAAELERRLRGLLGKPAFASGFVRSLCQFELTLVEKKDRGPHQMSEASEDPPAKPAPRKRKKERGLLRAELLPERPQYARMGRDARRVTRAVSGLEGQGARDGDCTRGLTRIDGPQEVLGSDGGHGGALPAEPTGGHAEQGASRTPMLVTEG